MSEQPQIGSHAAQPMDEPLKLKPVEQPDSELIEILLSLPGSATRNPDILLAEQRLLAWRDKGSLSARLVELDLFEQFLNRRRSYAITRESLEMFKMQRLEDLESRLKSENKQIS